MTEPKEYMEKAEKYRPSMWTKGAALLEAAETALERGLPVPVEKMGEILSAFPEDHRAFLARALELFTALRALGARPHTGYISFFGTKKENKWEMWEAEIERLVESDPAIVD